MKFGQVLMTELVINLLQTYYIMEYMESWYQS